MPRRKPWGYRPTDPPARISNVSDLLLTAARTVLAPNGTLNFTDFQVQRAGAKYGLLFTSTYAQKTAKATSTHFNVHHAEVFAIRITRQPDKWEDRRQEVAIAGVFFSVKAVLLDRFGNVATDQCHRLLPAPCELLINATISE